ncbi:tetratricopeptide repeat protein [Alienimonas californiensis]|uniref:Tetratricopeptide repeat protein n=1 Tax=Alienimonas californiensis TaxID=2527989 RepID=A0A517PFR9_9PLAN|nr:tetratricopeptide repeat protein [Alienimonas californiensis]QDT18232.1 tetratricopeptide repeat protein [Alienimonas californiensis]
MFRRDFHDDVDAPTRRRLDPTGLLRAPAALGRGIGHGSAVLWAGLRGRLAGGGRRSPWTLLAGLPALLAAAGLAAFLVAARQQKDDLRGAYAAAADRAAAAGETDAAVLHRRRLGQLGDGDAAARFRLAQALAAAGRDAEARDVLTGLLASADGPGHAPAHLLLASRLLTFEEPDAENPEGGNAEGSSAPPSEAERAARRSEALRHLAAARRAAPADKTVALRIAELSMQAGDADAAATTFEEIAPSTPVVWPDLVRVYAAQGRTAEAAAAAAEAVPVLRGRLKRDPLDLDSRLRLTDALARTGNFTAAEAVLTDGLPLHPSAAIPQRLAELHVAEYDRAARRARPPAERLALLGKALGRHPRSAEALVRLIAFSGAAGSTDDGEPPPVVAEARELLERTLASGEVPALAHFALGVNALAAGDRADGLFHFERAHALDPSLAAAANNLAFLYFKADPPQPERALGLADAAVAAAPANAHCHETRGQILAALDRPADALAALERAMALGLKNDPKVRAAVADLYDELNQPALARRFREPAPDETPGGTTAERANADGADAGS